MVTQTTLKRFAGPTEFDGDDALPFPNYINHLVASSSSTVNTVAISTQTRYLVINNNADCWINLGSTTVAAVIPSSNVTDGTGSWLVPGGASRNYTIALQSTDLGISLVSTSTGFKCSIGSYTD